MAITSNLAGVARVAFEAQTGEFNRDVSRAEQVYKGATDGMSDAAIKLELANERLRRSLAKGPSASREQARALLSVRQAERELTQETDRNSRAQERNQRELRQTARGAVAGSGALRGLGRSVAFASGSFLGTAGLVYGMRQALSAASNLDEQTTKTRAVFGDASGEVERFARNALGLANDKALETASSIGALLRPIGVVEKDAARTSVSLTKLGVDLSSFYNSDVASALDAIRSGLVGESEPLRRYGVQLSEARVQALALAESGKTNVKELTNQDKALARIRIILKDTTLAQGDYARTIGGAANQEREWQKNLRDTEAAIGRTLMPTYRNLLKTVNDYLGNAENQRRVQRQVNEAVQAGVSVVKGLAEGLKVVKAVAEPVVDALGGIEKAAQLALIVGIVAKARRAALGFLPLQASSAATATKGVRDAAIFGRAWDVATRPRVMTVAERIAPYGGTPGAPVPAPVPSGGRGGRTGRFPKIPFTLGLNVPTAVASAVLITGGATSHRDQYDPKRYPRIARALAAAEANGEYSPEFLSALATIGNVNGKSIRDLTAGQLAMIERNLVPQRTGVLGGDRDRPNMGRTPTAPRRPPRPRRGGGGGGDRGPARRTLIDVQTDLSRALTTPGTSDEERLYREQIRRYQADIRMFERRKTLTNTQKQTLQRLYGDLAQAQGSLDSIREQREQALADRREKAAARRTAIREKEERKQKAEERKQDVIYDRLARASGLNSAQRVAKETKAADAEAKGGLQLPRALRIKELQAQLTKDEADDIAVDKKIEAYWRGKLARAKKGSEMQEQILQQLVSVRNGGGTSAADPAVTRDELGTIFRDFLNGFGQMVDTYYSNVGGRGSHSTAVLEHLTREQTNVLRDAVTRPRVGFQRQLDEAAMLG